jgi:hypothetical protein
MTILIIWLCTTAALDDCKGYVMSKPIPAEQCEAMKEVYADTLGIGPEQNYFIDCEVHK